MFIAYCAESGKMELRLSAKENTAGCISVIFLTSFPLLPTSVLLIAKVQRGVQGIIGGQQVLEVSVGSCVAVEVVRTRCGRKGARQTQTVLETAMSPECFPLCVLVREGEREGGRDWFGLCVSASMTRTSRYTHRYYLNP